MALCRPRNERKLLFSCLCDEECIPEKGDSLKKEDSLAVEYYNLGTIQQAKGKLSEAIMYYKQSIALDNGNFKAFYNLGSALQEYAGSLPGNMGKQQQLKKQRQTIQDACLQYESAILLKPDHVLAHYNLGYIRHQLKQHDKALYHFQKACELDDSDGDTYIMIGNILREQQKLEEAAHHYSRATEVDPTCVMAYYNLGNTYHDLCRYDDAIASFNAALEINPSLSHAHFNIGIAYQGKGELEAAYESYQSAAQLDPDFEDAKKAALHIKRKMEKK